MPSTQTFSEQITEEVTSWPGIEAGPGRRGVVPSLPRLAHQTAAQASEMFYRRRELFPLSLCRSHHSSRNWLITTLPSGNTA